MISTGYVSAIFGLLGAFIGGITSFATAFVTQNAQLRNRSRHAARLKREELFSEFIVEATRLHGDAVSHETDDVTELTKLYAIIAKIRLHTSRKIVVSAESVLQGIVEAYLAPNLTLHQLRELVKTGGMNFLEDFSESCREELGQYQVWLREGD